MLVMSALCASEAVAQVNAQPARRGSGKGSDWVYVGTYTGAKSKGIYLYRLDLASGQLTAAGLAAETPNPTFLALAPNRRFLYAANEVGRFAGKVAGAVSGYAIDPATGQLTFLNQQSTVGPGPCHVIVDATGKCVLVANYSGGSVAVLPIEAKGRLGEASTFIQHRGSSADPRRQEGPHAHGIALDAANQFALVADLGLDRVMVYRLDAAKGKLEANDEPWAALKPGSGPRHLAFHPRKNFLYAITEMGSTITAFAYTPRQGTLRELQTVSTLPADFQGNNTCAEIAVHPSGRFLYGSNRGHNSIAVFAINQTTGQLSLVEHVSTQGKTPRNFGIDPTGQYLLAANQDTDNVVVFRIDRPTGRLTPTGQQVEVGAPVCVTFVPAP